MVQWAHTYDCSQSARMQFTMIQCSCLCPFLNISKLFELVPSVTPFSFPSDSCLGRLRRFAQHITLQWNVAKFRSILSSKKRPALVWARRANLLQEWEIQFQTHAVYLESCASHKSIEKQLDSRLLTMMFGFFSVKTTRILTQWTQGVYGTHHSRFPGVGPLQILSKMA